MTAVTACMTAVTASLLYFLLLFEARDSLPGVNPGGLTPRCGIINVITTCLIFIRLHQQIFPNAHIRDYQEK